MIISWQQRKNSLGLKLLLLILLFSSVVTLAGTALQIYLDYQSDISEIDERLNQIESSYLKSISKSLWDFDDGQLLLLMQGILQLPDIQYVGLSSDNLKLSVGVLKKSQTLKREYEIPSPKRNQPQIIGLLIVEVDLHKVYLRLWDKALVIFATQAVKTFLVSSFILFIFQILVTRHLVTMAQFAQQLDLNRLDQPLNLQRKESKAGREDELEKVVQAINQMRVTLKKSSLELESKARLDGELKTAAAVQRFFLPKKPPTLDGFDIASFFQPAKEVSGDYFDFIPINERFTAFVIADVSGKGVSAAIYASIVRVLLRDKIIHLTEPAPLLKALNDSLKHVFQSNRFVTLGYLLLDTKDSTVAIANAGHEPLIFIKANNHQIELLKPAGMPFSDFHSEHFAGRITQQTHVLESGDVLVCYTDGLTDVVNRQNEMFGEEAFYQVVKSFSHLSAAEMLQATYKVLMEFQQDAEQSDDITMIAIRKN